MDELAKFLIIAGLAGNFLLEYLAPDSKLLNKFLFKVFAFGVLLMAVHALIHGYSPVRGCRESISFANEPIEFLFTNCLLFAAGIYGLFHNPKKETE